FNGPMKAGCLGLGTAAVVVVDDQTSMVDVLYNCCRFMSHESCGQSTPCREGTSWMTKILERISGAEGKPAVPDTLPESPRTRGAGRHFPRGPTHGHPESITSYPRESLTTNRSSLKTASA